MNKYVLSFILLLSCANISYGQRYIFDSLTNELIYSKPDTNRVNILTQLTNRLKFRKPDLALNYGNQALVLARKLGYAKGETEVIDYLVLSYMTLGDDIKALQLTLHGIKVANNNNLDLVEGRLTNQLGYIYLTLGKYKEALTELQKAATIFDKLENCTFSAVTIRNIGRVYLAVDKLDSAKIFAERSTQLLTNCEAKWPTFTTLMLVGDVATAQGDREKAMRTYKRAITIENHADQYYECYLAVAKLFNQENNTDSSLYYAQRAMKVAEESGVVKAQITSAMLLSDLLEQQSDSKQSLYYSKLALSYSDSLKKLVNTNAMASILELDQRSQEYQVEIATTALLNKIKQNALIFALFIFLIIGVLLFRNYSIKKKDNEILASTLSDLKATQTQLIHAEKMASLGELTAGIAHEIQNPLNFVNNFSEVSGELLEELDEEILNGDMEEVKAISADLRQNLQKINNHGQRASSIVKGMLEHSRNSSGKKEFTDINKLADEYLRLSYHGLRAKDKNFNAAFDTEFEADLPAVEIASQDIGRVLLNLINNAFQAVNSKAKSNELESYQPKVFVSTKLVGQGVEINVKDNGLGIPDEIREKIFQPFFTTKPTGEGTGLGLSLAYDIITKGHGGTIEFSSSTENGTEFKVKLPIS